MGSPQNPYSSFTDAEIIGFVKGELRKVGDEIRRLKHRQNRMLCALDVIENRLEKQT